MRYCKRGLIDATDNQLRSPLICASIEGHGNVVAWLLSSGADATIRDSGGTTAEAWAEDLEQ